ncbi:MAG: multidrug transporter, partial [Bacillota bacterium]|nr:multidrug transporter [Bacillota bacterium]
MANFIVKFRFLILAVFIVALVGAGMASLGVVTNYEMSKYLSGDMPAVLGMNKTIEEFGIPTTVRVMVEDTTLVEAVEIKEKIKAAPYVRSITWL